MARNVTLIRASYPASSSRLMSDAFPEPRDDYKIVDVDWSEDGCVWVTYLVPSP